MPLFLFLSATCLFGQGFGSIAGTVKDPSGAVIPSAIITAVQVSTGTTVAVKTNNVGFFVFPSLPPATYSLSASPRGFQKYVQTGITLEANQAATVNIQLQIGADTQAVTVSADASQVDTTTGTLSQVIDTRRVNDLPLNGRNAATLSSLVAGVVIGPNENSDQGPTKTFPAAVTISANGSRVGETNYMLDGGNNMDEYTNVNGPFPFPDALQEFSVQTSNFNAEYGENAGAVVNIVTKSGGKGLHGDVFEYLRNGAFNARNYFAAEVDPLHRNQFGLTVGGPVIVPHVLNGHHTFFFFGYQKTIIHNQASGNSAIIPTQAMLQGDFSSVNTQIYDPLTGATFAKNQIPVQRFDPASLAFLKHLPTPTATGLIFYQVPVIQNFNEYLARVDQDITPKDHLFAHYYYNRFVNAGELNTSNLLTYSSQSSIPFQSALLSETHIFGSNIVNNAILNYTRETSTRAPLPGGPDATAFGVNIYEPATPALETISASGDFNVGDSPPAVFLRNNYTLADNLHWVKGSHNFAFGFTAENSKEDTNNQTKESGVFNFNPSTKKVGSTTLSNTALTNFLLGYMHKFTQGSGQYLNVRDQFLGFYAQDSWKISRRLTLNYGVRYEPFFPWREKFHRVTEFSPSAYAAGVKSKLYLNAPPGMLFAGDAGIPEQGINPSYKCIMPRFGFALDLFGDGKTSLRGGGGVFYNTRLPAIMMNNLGSSSTPFSVQVTLTQPTGPFSDPYKGNTNPFPLTTTAIENTVFPAPVTVTTYDPYNDFKVPVIYSWNLTVEQQLTNNVAFRLAYAGSHSSHIFTSPDLNPSVYIPGSNLSATKRAVFQGYGGISAISMGGNGSYHSLQATLEQRFSHGLTVLVNYTFSKSLDDLPDGEQFATAKNGSNSYVYPVFFPNYKSLDRGPSDFDRRNVISASYVYDLPKMNSRYAVVRALVNGWRQSGLIQYRSGGPLTILAGQDISQTNILQDRAQRVITHNPYGHGACKADTTCVDYLNPASFALPAVGSFGDVQKGAFTGPGYVNMDAGLMRDVHLGERVKLQFRAEYFNVLNHTNLSDPDTDVSSQTFGSITGANDPRIGQLALKAIF